MLLPKFPLYEGDESGRLLDTSLQHELTQWLYDLTERVEGSQFRTAGGTRIDRTKFTRHRRLNMATGTLSVNNSVDRVRIIDPKLPFPGLSSGFGSIVSVFGWGGHNSRLLIQKETAPGVFVNVLPVSYPGGFIDIDTDSGRYSETFVDANGDAEIDIDIAAESYVVGLQSADDRSCTFNVIYSTEL